MSKKKKKKKKWGKNVLQHVIMTKKKKERKEQQFYQSKSKVCVCVAHVWFYSQNQHLWSETESQRPTNLAKLLFVIWWKSVKKYIFPWMVCVTNMAAIVLFLMFLDSRNFFFSFICF